MRKEFSDDYLIINEAIFLSEIKSYRLRSCLCGFPSQIATEPILESLLPEPETFPDAEERRLFYVALTRARDHVYLIYDPREASDFVVELLTPGSYPVITEP